MRSTGKRGRGRRGLQAARAAICAVGLLFVTLGAAGVGTVRGAAASGSTPVATTEATVTAASAASTDSSTVTTSTSTEQTISGGGPHTSATPPSSPAPRSGVLGISTQGLNTGADEPLGGGIALAALGTGLLLAGARRRRNR